MKQNHFLPFALIFTPIKPICIYHYRYPSYLLLMLPQINVRYGVNYKHHKRYW